MLYKAKSRTGTWVEGFLIGYYDSVDKNSISSFAIFEGFDTIDPIPVEEDTICEFVCLDVDGNKAYTNDVIEIREGDRYVLCILEKGDMGYSIHPNYQEGSLWRLTIANGVGHFKVRGSIFENKKLADWLEQKDKWFKERIEKRWQKLQR